MIWIDVHVFLLLISFFGSNISYENYTQNTPFECDALCLGGMLPPPHPPPQKKITMGYHYFLLEEKPWVCATMIWPHRLSQSLETFALSSSSQIFVAKITANCAPNIFAPYLLPLSAIRFSPTSRCNASASATQTFLNTRPPCWTVVGRDGHSIRSVRGKTAWILVPEQQRQFAKTAAFRRIQ